MNLSQRILAGLLASLLVAIAFVLVAGRSSKGANPAPPPSSSRFDGGLLPPGLHAADFALTDQAGRRITLSQYRGKVVVLTFIHSHCKDTCPFMVEQIKGALDDLPGRGRDVPAIGISVQPAEDTAASRVAFLRRHEMLGRMAFLSGPLKSLTRVWHAYAIQPVQGPVDHSTFVLLIDRRGIERIGYPADQLTPEDLAHDIRALEAAPA